MQVTSSSHVEQLNHDGFVIFRKCLDLTSRDLIAAQIEEAAEQVSIKDDSIRRRAGIFGIRNLLDVVPALRDVVHSPALVPLLAPLQSGPIYLVRALLFDKSEQANWQVAWHQDLSIAVLARMHAEGFSNWSSKAGVAHVQPPAWYLERMVTLRVHLDDCDQTNGALRVIPGSHSRGKLTAEQINLICRSRAAADCEVPAGGVLMMRPLLLHSSRKSTRPARRRVIHLEFSGDDLPGPLQWHQRLPVLLDTQRQRSRTSP